MKRKEFYSALPNPDEVGQSEYTLLHNFLVDAINEWVSSDDEEIDDFVEASLFEIDEWTALIRERLNQTSGRDSK